MFVCTYSLSILHVAFKSALCALHTMWLMLASEVVDIYAQLFLALWCKSCLKQVFVLHYYLDCMCRFLYHYFLYVQFIVIFVRLF